MSHSDSASLPPGDCDPAPQRPSRVITTGFIPLPAQGEVFTAEHYPAIAAQMRRPISRLFFEYRKLRQAGVEECDLVGYVLTRAMESGVIHTSAERLVNKLTYEAIGRAQRTHHDFFRLGHDSLDDPNFSVADCSVTAAPTAPDAAADCDATELAADAICWMFPDADPQAAATLSLWVGRTGKEALSIRELAEKYRPLAEQLESLYRRWKRYFLFSKEQAGDLFALLRAHPRFPLCYPYFYFAADRSARSAGNLVQVFRATVTRDPGCFEAAVAAIRTQARLKSRAKAKTWRETDEAHRLTRRLTAEYANTLSELI